MLTVVSSDAWAATQSSSERGREICDEDNRLSDDNENRYEKNFTLDSIITFLERRAMKMVDKMPENGEFTLLIFIKWNYTLFKS